MRKRWNKWRRQTCQPRQQTKKAEENKAPEHFPRRKHATWGDIGIAEYNPQATKWECRFEHCQQEMDTEKNTLSQEQKVRNRTLGNTLRSRMPVLQQDIQCVGRIIHTYRTSASEMKSRHGNMPNATDRRHPGGKWTTALLKMKGTCVNSDYNARNSHININR